MHGEKAKAKANEKRREERGMRGEERNMDGWMNELSSVDSVILWVSIIHLVKQ